MALLDILGDTPERIERELGFADEAIVLAHDFIEGGARSYRQTISALFLARGLQCLRSVCILTPHGALGDAMSIARTLVELDIEHAYIMAKDTDDRWERFVMFDQANVHKILKGISALNGASTVLTDATLEQWKQRAQAAKQFVGDDRCWAGKGIDTRKRAIATGRDHQYDVAYRDMCGASHAGFSTFAYVTDLTKAELPIQIIVGYGPPSAKAVALGMASLLGLLRDGLNTADDDAQKYGRNADPVQELTTRLDDLHRRLRDAYDDLKRDQK